MGKYDELVDLIENESTFYPISLNAKSLDNWTAVHYACSEGHLQIIEYLIENQADLNAKTTFMRTGLHIASLRGYDKIVALLVSQKNIEINAQDKDLCTAMHYAAQYDHIEVVKALLSKNPDLSLKNYLAQTPLESTTNISVFKVIEKHMQNNKY